MLKLTIDNKKSWQRQQRLNKSFDESCQKARKVAKKLTKVAKICQNYLLLSFGFLSEVAAGHQPCSRSLLFCFLTSISRSLISWSLILSNFAHFLDHFSPQQGNAFQRLQCGKSSNIRLTSSSSKNVILENGYSVITVVLWLLQEVSSRNALKLDIFIHQKRHQSICFNFDIWPQLSKITLYVAINALFWSEMYCMLSYM